MANLKDTQARQRAVRSSFGHFLTSYLASDDSGLNAPGAACKCSPWRSVIPFPSGGHRPPPTGDDSRACPDWLSARIQHKRTFSLFFRCIVRGPEPLPQPVDDAAGEQQVHLPRRQIVPQRNRALAVAKRGDELFS